MNISQRDRHDLYTRLRSALGDSAATNLMDLLPLHPTSDLATRADMAVLRDTVRGEIAEVRGEIAELRGELKGDMASLRTELKGDMASLDSRLSREMGRLYRCGAAVVVANAISTITVLLAA